jgi:hypothetical protein
MFQIVDDIDAHTEGQRRLKWYLGNQTRLKGTACMRYKDNGTEIDEMSRTLYNSDP